MRSLHVFHWPAGLTSGTSAVVVTLKTIHPIWFREKFAEVYGTFAQSNCHHSWRYAVIQYVHIIPQGFLFIYLNTVCVHYSTGGFIYLFKYTPGQLADKLLGELQGMIL